MRRLLTLLAIVSLGLSVAACGTASRDASNASATNPSTSGTSTHNDRDNDGDNNDDDQHVLGFGHVAGEADSQAITTLVTRYFSAAAAENGRDACALLAPFIAESVAEDYGHSPGLSGKTCVVVLSKLLERYHQDLVNKDASLKVMRIGVEGDKSLVALEFPSIPVVRQIIARRIGNTWTMLTLRDGNIE